MGEFITPYNAKVEGADNVYEINGSNMGNREDSINPFIGVNSAITPEDNLEDAGKGVNPQDMEK